METRKMYEKTLATPSKEFCHIPAGERDNHLQICIGRGYVSSLEDICYDTLWQTNIYSNGISPFSIGNTSSTSKGQFSIAMLVYWSV